MVSTAMHPYSFKEDPCALRSLSSADLNRTRYECREHILWHLPLRALWACGLLLQIVWYFSSAHPHGTLRRLLAAVSEALLVLSSALQKKPLVRNCLTIKTPLPFSSVISRVPFRSLYGLQPHSSCTLVMELCSH